MNAAQKTTAQPRVEAAVLRSHLPIIWIGTALIGGSALLNLAVWLAR